MSKPLDDSLFFCQQCQNFKQNLDPIPPTTQHQTFGHLIEFRLLKFTYAFDRNDNFSHYLHYFPCIKTIADQPQQFASTSIRHQAHELKDDGM